MKKRTLILFATAALVITGTITAAFPVFANSDIKSKGNLIFEEGDLEIQTEDISTLKSELAMLQQELPNPSDENVEIPVIPEEDFVRKKEIRSRGIINYDEGTVVIDSSDFTYLADEIDVLERTYKQYMLGRLNGINTYLDTEGNVTHNITESDTSRNPSFLELLNGITLSQEVVTGTTADNLSKDKGAWINGEYINGNGNDVNEAYARGYQDGADYATGHADITYSYHEHIGTEEEEGGCYGNVSKTCAGPMTKVRYTNTVPNPNTDGFFKYYDLKCNSCGYSTNDWLTEAEIGGVVPVYRNHKVTGIQLVCGKTTDTIESATITFD